MASTTSAHVCPPPMVATSNGIFQGNNPLEYALPLAILQICLIVFITRTLAFLLKPLRQPRVIAEIIGGILLGPSALGRSKMFLNSVFPSKSLTVLDTLANLGLLFFLFLVGLELDPKSLRKTGKKALAIAVTGITVPFALGIGSSFVLLQTISKGVHGPSFLVFMGVALSITAFPVLARILAELKLLNTDVGRLAMSAAVVNDVAAWVFLALAIALSTTGHSAIVSLWVFLSRSCFVFFAIIVLPPVFKWMAKRCEVGRPVDELYICVTLVVVLVAGFVTDAIGIHALFGGFVVGILVPKDGPFAVALVEKLEDLVSGLFLPLYFVSSGLKTNVATIQGAQSWGLLALLIFVACSGKILGTLVVSLLSKVPIREALALGFLINSKGLVELIVLNIGRDRKVLNEQTFSIMVLMALFTTFITTPLVTAVYKPAIRLNNKEYMHRTIERKDPSTQLRVLTCFHSTNSIPTLVNLMEISHGSDQLQGLSVYCVHLMELSERPSTILMANKARKNGLPFWSKRRRMDSDHVVSAFEAFQQLCRVTVKPMRALSAMSSIHEDICSSAERKRVAMVILPFHQHQRMDGSIEMLRADFRMVNQRVLEEARCSVGILIDQGFARPAQSRSSSDDAFLSITVVFFGGCDDREALAYGVRMAEHPGISLTVLHFSMEHEINEGALNNSDDFDPRNQSIDDKCLSEFQQNIQISEGSMKYQKRIAQNAAEIIAVIGEFSLCNLFLVGRSPEGEVAAALNARNDHTDQLGPAGSLLASSESFSSASVLIMQQFKGSSSKISI